MSPLLSRVKFSMILRIEERTNQLTKMFIHLTTPPHIQRRACIFAWGSSVAYDDTRLWQAFLHECWLARDFQHPEDLSDICRWEWEIIKSFQFHHCDRISFCDLYHFSSIAQTIQLQGFVINKLHSGPFYGNVDNEDIS